MLKPVRPSTSSNDEGDGSAMPSDAAVSSSDEARDVAEELPSVVEPPAPPPPAVQPGFERSRKPKPLPEVKPPTAAEEARHRLTHLPYRRWCRFCVAARMLNTPHRKLPPFSREIPLIVFDYCFIKSQDDPKFLTVLVGKLYPFKAIFAVACPKKGPDQFVTRRFAGFLRQCCITRMTYMSDQEASIHAMVTEALEVAKASGEYLGAVPEKSAVGESQSNSRAERYVQHVEDHVRTLFAELEFHVGVKISSEHPSVAG